MSSESKLGSTKPLFPDNLDKHSNGMMKCEETGQLDINTIVQAFGEHRLPNVLLYPFFKTVIDFADQTDPSQWILLGLDSKDTHISNFVNIYVKNVEKTLSDYMGEGYITQEEFEYYMSK